MNVIPFKPWHLRDMRLQAAQVSSISYLSDEYLMTLADGNPCLSAEHNGRILGCCGITRSILGGGMIWGLVSKDAGRHMVILHRALERFIDAVPLIRVEATVERGFEPGCRWLDLLGFEFEGVMRKFGPDGSDHLRYAKVR